MNRPSRIRITLSSVAIAAMLSGCATGQQNRESIFGSKVDHENIGLATRAQMALNSQEYAKAVDLAERAVENSPSDAGFRTLLGNAYFAAGRFASAEQAYEDSLSLFAGQPKLILKLALVQIAQGKNGEALAMLDAARGAIDAADYGLAVALAGEPAVAVQILDEAARSPNADARVRQNLALAFALSGDWTMARTVAAQDVPPEQLDQRIQQWMAMATPSHASDQVAALTGVTPAADPGQPQRLALNGASQNQVLAEAAPMVPAPQPEPQPQPQFAEVPAAPPPALPEPMALAASVSEPELAEAARSLLKPAPVVPQAVPAANIEEAPSAPVAVAAAAPVEPEPVAKLPTSFEAVEPPKFVAVSDKVRRAAKKERRSNSVVQLGAYSSSASVSAAWTSLTKRFPALADYTPMRARFEGPKGTVWRLSIKGFDSQREAQQRCETLRSRGGKCFVRKAAGDAPVQFASR